MKQKSDENSLMHKTLNIVTVHSSIRSIAVNKLLSMKLRPDLNGGLTKSTRTFDQF